MRVTSSVWISSIKRYRVMTKVVTMSRMSMFMYQGRVISEGTIRVTYQRKANNNMEFKQ